MARKPFGGKRAAKFTKGGGRKKTSRRNHKGTLRKKKGPGKRRKR